MTFDDFAKVHLLRQSFIATTKGTPVKSEAYLTRVRGEHHFVI
jgi:hypothetical protein